MPSLEIKKILDITPCFLLFQPMGLTWYIDIGLAMVKAGLVEAMLRYLPATHAIS